jgi:hypothetical protein
MIRMFGAPRYTAIGGSGRALRRRATRQRLARRSLRLERGLTRHHLVEQRAEGENVRSLIAWCAFQLLRRSIAQRAENAAL